MTETRLTKKELADLRIRLVEERVQLDTQLTTIETDSFASTQSDSSGDVGLDDEPADAGTATFEREKDLSIENNVRDLLHKIDRALKRMDDGTYGICDICGKPIEKARVKALPYVDADNGGSVVDQPKTLATAIATVKNVDTIINGHIPVSTWSDLRDYADFTRDFVTYAEGARKAGKTVDQAAAEYKLPTRYKGYVLTINPGFVTAKSNLQIAYDELAKR